MMGGSLFCAACAASAGLCAGGAGCPVPGACEGGAFEAGGGAVGGGAGCCPYAQIPEMQNSAASIKEVRSGFKVSNYRNSFNPASITAEAIFSARPKP